MYQDLEIKKNIRHHYIIEKKELNLKRNIKFWSIEFQMTDLWIYILFHLDIKFLMRIMLFFLEKLTFLQIQIKCNFITHLWAPVFLLPYTCLNKKNICQIEKCLLDSNKI
jgi:hypothetical protein